MRHLDNHTIKIIILWPKQNNQEEKQRQSDEKDDMELEEEWKQKLDKK